MKTTRILTALVAPVFLVANANATDFYVSANLGASVFDDAANADASSDALTLDGETFDSTETAWGLAAGWQVLPWLAVELGYSDLGESGTSSPLFGTFPLATPTLNLPATFFTNPAYDIVTAPGSASFGVGTPTSLPPRFRGAALDVDQWHVGAKFRKALTEKFDAHWYLGVARTSFDARGSVSILVPTVAPTGNFSGPLVLMDVPNATPDAEVGINWGAGFDWHLFPRLDLGIQWRRHHTGVVDVDSFRVTVATRL